MLFLFVSLPFIDAEPGSYFHRFFSRTKDMTPRERAIALEEDDEVRVAERMGELVFCFSAP